MPILLLVAGACQRDSASPEVSESGGEEANLVPGACEGTPGKPHQNEGEFYGKISQNGVTTCLVYQVSLAPADEATAAGLRDFDGSLATVPAYGWDFEYWDPAGGGPCQGTNTGPATEQDWVDYFLSGSGSVMPEAHPVAYTHERHCIRPGRYNFALQRFGEDVFPPFRIDYVRIGRIMAGGPGGAGIAVEDTLVNPNSTLFKDLRVDVEFGAAASSVTRVLEIDNAGQAPFTTAFSGQATPSGTALDWFRFAAHNSSTSWEFGDIYLARLYYDGTMQGGTMLYADTTGYFDVKSVQALLRVRRFPNPATATRNVVVGLEIQAPPSIGRVSSPLITLDTIVITRINPDLTPSSLVGPGSMTVGTNASFTVYEQNLHSQIPVESGWRGALYLSTDATWSANDLLLSSFNETRELAPSSQLTTARTVAIAGGQTPGSYYVIAKLDTLNSVIESQETNNVIAVPLTVNAAPSVPTTITIAPSPVPLGPSPCYKDVTATVRDAAGNDITASVTVNWSVDDENIAWPQSTTGSTIRLWVQTTAQTYVHASVAGTSLTTYTQVNANRGTCYPV